MATLKMTFSLDRETATRLQQAAQRLGKAKSEVVREAVAEYAARVGRLSESERRELLRSFDRLVPAIPARPVTEVEAELAQVRSARRTGGRAGARNTAGTK